MPEIVAGPGIAFSIDPVAGTLTISATGSGTSLPVISLSTPSVSHAEGASGTTTFVYNVTRSGDLSSTSSASWAVTGTGGSPANATDFVGAALPSGTVSFGPAENAKTITANVAGDSTVEPDENFTLTLSSPVNATLGTSTATGTITNDDSAPVKFLAEGDSITVSTSPLSYSRQWAADHSTITYSNTAVGGAVTGSPGDTAPTNSLYARQASDLAYAPTHMSVFIGANDLNGSTASYIANLYNYLAPFKSAGTKIVLCTVLPRSGVTGQEGWRAAFNTQLRADKGTQFDDLVDFDTCALGVAGASDDTTLFSDGTHPTLAGHVILKGVYAPVVNHLLGIANEPQNFSFAPVSAGTADTDYDSADYVVQGLYPGETRPYSVPTGVKVSKNDGTFVLNGSGTVVNGDKIKVRNHSSTSNATTTTVSATIGTTTASFQVTTAGAGTRDWVPTDLGSKLALWLKPESLTGADGSSITTWPDSSGHSVSVPGTGSSGQPTVAAAALNSLNAAALNSGLQEYFLPPSSHLTGRTGTAGSATFVVSKNAASGINGPPLPNWGTDNTGEYYPYTTGDIYLNYCSTTRQTIAAPGPALTAWHLASFHSKTNDWRYYIDGTNFSTFATNAFAANTGIRIGYGFGGQIAEVVDCSDALTSTERQQVEGYLAWKFGLQANLPTGHPYKAAKPTI